MRSNKNYNQKARGKPKQTKKLKSVHIKSNIIDTKISKKRQSVCPKTQKSTSVLPKIDCRVILFFKSMIVSFQPYSAKHNRNSIEFDDALFAFFIHFAHLRTQRRVILVLHFP